MVYEKEKVSQRNRNKVPKPPNVIWISNFIVELTCSSKLKPILFISLSFPPSLTSQFVQPTWINVPFVPCLANLQTPLPFGFFASPVQQNPSHQWTQPSTFSFPEQSSGSGGNLHSLYLPELRDPVSLGIFLNPVDQHALPPLQTSYLPSPYLTTFSSQLYLKERTEASRPVCPHSHFHTHFFYNRDYALLIWGYQIYT